jgi:hypothetical protein
MPWETLVERPSGPLDDVGPEVLDRLFGELQIEAEWGVRDGRAFTWWPWAMAVRVEASEPGVAFGDPMVRVRAEADVLRGVTAGEDLVLATLSLVNTHASLASFVWDPDRASVTAVTTAYLYRGNLTFLPVLSTAILLTTSEAHARAPRLAGVLGGEPATSARPGSPLRNRADDLLSIPAEVVPREGAGPSRFLGAMAEAVMPPTIAWCMTTVSREGFTGELPFFGTVPASVAAMTGEELGQTALVQYWAVRHPSYGSGLVMVMRLPVEFGASEEVRRVANDLNRAEATTPTGFPLMGAWCEDPRVEVPTLSFVTFVPSLLARPGLVATLSFYLQLRCWWARARLA